MDDYWDIIFKCIATCIFSIFPLMIYNDCRKDERNQHNNSRLAKICDKFEDICYSCGEIFWQIMKVITVLFVIFGLCCGIYGYINNLETTIRTDELSCFNNLDCKLWTKKCELYNCTECIGAYDRCFDYKYVYQTAPWISMFQFSIIMGMIFIVVKTEYRF